MSDRDLVARAVANRRPGPSGWARTNCPLCVTRVGKVDRRYSLGVHARTGVYHCFKCEAKGRLDGAQYEEPVSQTRLKSPTTVLEPPESFIPLFEGDGRHAMSLDAARDYVLRPTSQKGRGLPESVAREAGIGACTSGRFAGRVIVPVFDDAGRWRWYVGRSWVPKCDNAYLYPVGDRSGVLFNEHALTVKTDEPLLIVEGVFDALAHWPNAVAALGKPTDPQHERIARAPRPVCVVLDGDAPDDALSCALALHALGHSRVGIVMPKAMVDPDEIPRDELSRLARQACAAA